MRIFFCSLSFTCLFVFFPDSVFVSGCLGTLLKTRLALNSTEFYQPLLQSAGIKSMSHLTWLSIRIYSSHFFSPIPFFFLRQSLSMSPWLASNSQKHLCACLCLQSSGYKGVYYCTWSSQVFLINNSAFLRAVQFIVW